MSKTSEALIKGLSREAPADECTLRELISFIAEPLPDDYIELLRCANGASGWLEGDYLILYSATEVVRVNRAAATSRYVPGMLIFASNGGGTSYLLELEKASSAHIYRCEDVDLSRERSVRLASSIEEFIRSFSRLAEH